MTGLRIAPDLALPLSFATEGVVVIGVRGSGKSNTEVRFAELLHGADVPFVAIDPKGDWYGIRMDGTAPGLPIPVFGGLYGDFLIDEHLGARIADLLVDNNMSAVLDVSRMSHRARGRFLTDFFKRLMERHQVEPHVRTVIFEEAHRYIPQTVKGDAATLKEAASAVLLEGRSFGLGCWACTQRPARLHNDVLEEVDTAIFHRIGVTATADLKRVRDWVKHEDLGEEIGASLTKLKAGEAWVLSPVSLGVVQRVQIDRRTTFDSGATPVVGEPGVMKRRLSTMADIDASAIKEALADAIEKAKEKDPAELTKRIRDLEKQLAARPTAEPERIEVPVRVEIIPGELIAAVNQARRALLDSADALTKTSADLETAEQRAHERNAAQPEVPVTGRPSGTARPQPAQRPQASPKPQASQARPAGDGSTTELGKGERVILTAIAQYDDGVTREQLTVLTGYKRSSRDTYLQRLRQAALVELDGQRLTATNEGIEALGDDYEPLPTGAALREHWLTRLGDGGEGVILAALIDSYPAGLTRDEISERTTYKRSSRDTYIQRLRARQLITTTGTEIHAADTLFDGGR